MNPPTFRAAAPADWAAKAQEAASVSAALAWVAMGDLALVLSLKRIVFTAATCRKFHIRERSRR